MVWLKKSWFSVVGVVLLAIIAFNVWQIAGIRSPTPSAGNEAATASTSSNRADGQNQKAVPENLTPSPAPHEITIRLAATNGEAEFDGDSLSDSVKTIGSVEEAVLEGKTLKVTLTGPINLSELLGRLSLQQVAVVEDEFQLHGALRLHASGMTWQGCASAFREELSSLEGVEVKGIDLRSAEEGYAYLSVAEKSSLTLAKLKNTVKNTPFKFVDMQWIVKKPQNLPNGSKQ